jgi:hypothetical protein
MLKSRISELERQRNVGPVDYLIQRVIVYGDGPPPPFPPGDGRPRIGIVRRITSNLPTGVMGNGNEVSSGYHWQRRRWR